jgi:hypothetical protein
MEKTDGLAREVIGRNVKCGLAEVEQDLSLDVQFQQMDGALNHLFNTLEELDKVVAQFVKPDWTEEDKKAMGEIDVPPQNISPVANTVHEFTEKIRRAVDGLDDIIRRVDYVA